MDTRRIQIGRLPVDIVNIDEALDVIDRMVRQRAGGTVFTPNADHVVQAEDDARFRQAYEATQLSLADGVSVVWSSRLLGDPVPMKISGSDLVMPLLRLAAARGHRVFFLGADPGVAELAKSAVERALPGIQVVGVDSPMIQVDHVDGALIEKIRAAQPDIVLVALGAPKQEIFCHEHRDALAPAVLLGIGASLDFIAGTKRRAPRWISESGLEWLYRLAQEPRRLAYRYLIRDPRFVGIVFRQWWSHARHVIP
jgi:N-acetylglucosaminyldiphosphoundecaprenol N-acetyl-beta-D-mannosaminyltransferase